jgi:hypothetical protein
MGAFAERLARGERPRWIERTEYCGRLLAGGDIPWADVGGFISWQRQAEGLIKSDVTVFPLAVFCAAWIAAHPELGEAMRQKSRTLHALKTMLADEAMRRHIGECLSALGDAKGSRMLVLAMPSPGDWIGIARAQAGAGPASDIGIDEMETAAMYVADFLRAFAETKLDALLLEEGETPGEAAVYQPVLNLAGHYNWDVGLLSDGAKKTKGIAFVIAAEGVPGVPTGIAQSDAFWSGAAVTPCGADGFIYARVPAACAPETVLERLAAI